MMIGWLRRRDLPGPTDSCLASRSNIILFFPDCFVEDGTSPADNGSVSLSPELTIETHLWSFSTNQLHRSMLVLSTTSSRRLRAV